VTRLWPGLHWFETDRVAGSRHIFTIIQLNFVFFNDPANRAFNDNLEDHPVVKSSLPALAADLGRPQGTS